ncbi:hypothetical protein LCGC14_1388740 [marine sediment metagenome]|uniref:Uncharacterized protein n=1 Tax=marine sediment metagenome TaxID=412755 RepID=A0A0F9MG40_9ZZZZ
MELRIKCTCGRILYDGDVRGQWGTIYIPPCACQEQAEKKVKTKKNDQKTQTTS